jgi:hypothetical protein
MKQSRSTYALADIAAFEFADNMHQAEVCAVLGYYAAYSRKFLPMF